jgi:hypothetical protein
MQRILAATTWPELSRFAAREQKSLDVAHAAALLTRLPEVLPGLLPLPAPLVAASAQQDTKSGSAGAAAAAAGSLQTLETLSGPVPSDAADARVRGVHVGQRPVAVFVWAGGYFCMCMVFLPHASSFLPCELSITIYVCSSNGGVVGDVGHVCATMSVQCACAPRRC